MSHEKALHRHRPWLVAAAGLLLGLLSQRCVRHHPSITSEEPGLRTSRLPPTAATSAPLASGPTTAEIREISEASKDEFLTRVREIFDQRARGKEIELEAIFCRWLDFEKPEEILTWLNSLEGSQQSDWNAAFFHAWVALDEQAAMADTRFTQLCPARALFAIRHADPEFARYVVNTGHSFSFDDKAEAALASLARNRPDIARLVAEANIPAELKSKFLTAVARGWAMSNPEEALTWLASIGPSGSNPDVAAVFSEWLRSDPQAAIEAAERLGLKDLTMRDDRIAGQALRAMTSPDSPVSWLSIALHRDPFTDLTALYQQLSAIDLNWEKPGFLQSAINHDGWYGVDPAGDAEKAANLPPGKARDFIMAAICQNWAAHDPEAALRYADEHGIRSPEIDSLRKQPTEETRQRILAAPEKNFAALMGAGDLPSGMSRDQLYTLAMEWSAADPVAAADWLVTREIPKSDAHADMLFRNTIGYHWAKNDPLGASRWMEDLPDGALKARAWGAMEESVTRYSPDLAFALSAAYLDGDSRGRYLTRELEEVRKNIGYHAALELLKSSELSAGESRDLARSLDDAYRGATK